MARVYNVHRLLYSHKYMRAHHKIRKCLSIQISQMPFFSPNGNRWNNKWQTIWNVLRNVCGASGMQWQQTIKAKQIFPISFLAMTASGADNWQWHLRIFSRDWNWQEDWPETKIEREKCGVNRKTVYINFAVSNTITQFVFSTTNNYIANTYVLKIKTRRRKKNPTRII